MPVQAAEHDLLQRAGLGAVLRQLRVALRLRRLHTGGDPAIAPCRTGQDRTGLTHFVGVQNHHDVERHRQAALLQHRAVIVT